MITKADDGLSGWAVQHGQAVRVAELAHDSRYVEVKPGLHSGMYIPLKVGERCSGRGQHRIRKIGGLRRG